MLLVKHKLDKDNYGGIGLFSDQFITKGDFIWIWDNDVEITYTIEKFKSLPEAYKSFLYKYSYQLKNGLIVLNVDNSRFMNHSDTPNTFEMDNGNIVSTQDINIGNELTCDYNKFNHNNDFCGQFLNKDIK